MLTQDGIANTGLGLSLDQAMTPAIVERAGVKIAFVGWTIIGGIWKAGPNSAAVAWLTRPNVLAGATTATPCCSAPEPAPR